MSKDKRHEGHMHIRFPDSFHGIDPAPDLRGDAEGERAIRGCFFGAFLGMALWTIVGMIVWRVFFN
jgi:hypothetical protein